MEFLKIKKFRSVLQIFGSIFGLILLIQQIINGFSKINPITLYELKFEYLFFSIIASIIALLFQIYGWIWLINSIGYTFKLKNTIFGYTFTFLPRYIPGTIWGYLTRSEWLFKSHNIPYKESLFVSLAEMLVIFLVNLLIGLSLLSTTNTFIFFAFIVFFLSIANFLMLRNDKFSQYQDIVKMSAKIKANKWISLFFIILISWLFYGMSLSLTFFSFNFDFALSIQNILLITRINSFSWLVGFIIIFVPAGIGVREYVLTQLIGINFYLSNSISSTISVSYRIITLFSEIILLFIGLLLYRKFNNSYPQPDQ